MLSFNQQSKLKSQLADQSKRASSSYGRWKTALSRLAGLAILTTLAWAGSTMAAVTVVDEVRGLEDDNYAAGHISVGGRRLANWFLSSSVADTDYANDAISGGSQGAQYVMMNAVRGSTDVNSIVFSVLPFETAEVTGIKIVQSPYFDAPGTWNGGNSEISQFKLSWQGGGLASITDPDDQVADFTDGALFASGTTLRFSDSRIFNDTDSWQIRVPAGVQAVQLDWSTTRPAANSDLTREWVTFDANVALVPEPGTNLLFCLAAFVLLGESRRRTR